jgi:hypothetical protein
MATTGKFLGRNTILKFGTASATTTVPQTSSIGEVRKTSPKVDVTDLQSPAHEYLPGLPDPSTITCQTLWDPTNATHTQLITHAAAGTVLFWAIEVYDRTSPTPVKIKTGAFQGYIAEIAQGPFENQTPINMPLVIQMSGDINWT